MIPVQEYLHFYQKCRQNKQIRNHFFKMILDAHFLKRHHTFFKYVLFGKTIYAPSFQVLIYLFEEIFIDKVYQIREKINVQYIYDFGAHIGMSLLYFTETYPHAMINAFEPHPGNFTLLEEGTAQWAGRFQLHQKGIAAQTGISFIDEHKNSLNYRLSDNQHLPIETKTIDISEVNFLPDSCIKMDIEGGEAAVLNQLFDQHKWDHINVLMIEFHPESLSGDIETWVQRFDEVGYTALYVSPEQQENSDQIIHFYKKSKIKA